jgi:hypothetical protein
MLYIYTHIHMYIYKIININITKGLRTILIIYQYFYEMEGI